MPSTLIRGEPCEVATTRKGRPETGLGLPVLVQRDWDSDWRLRNAAKALLVRDPRAASGARAAQCARRLLHRLRVLLQHAQTALQPGQPILLGCGQRQGIQAV